MQFLYESCLRRPQPATTASLVPSGLGETLSVVALGASRSRPCDSNCISSLKTEPIGQRVGLKLYIQTFQLSRRGASPWTITQDHLFLQACMRNRLILFFSWHFPHGVSPTFWHIFTSCSPPLDKSHIVHGALPTIQPIPTTAPRRATLGDQRGVPPLVRLTAPAACKSPQIVTLL